VKRILLDTNAYTAFKKGDRSAVEIIRAVETVGFSTVVLGELLSGFAAGRRAAGNRAELAELLVTSGLCVRGGRHDGAILCPYLYGAAAQR